MTRFSFPHLGLRLPPLRRRARRRFLPLRLRIAIGSAALVFVLSFSLLFFINIAALNGFSRIIHSSGLDWPRTVVSNGTRLRNTLPPLPAPWAERLAESFARRHLNPVERALLLELQSISLIGLALVAVLGGLGAYWLAGTALRPLRQVSNAARRISVETLDTRLALMGPRDEIKELADAFDAMLARLGETFAQQGRFVANVAHELRTPLAAMRASLEVVTSDPQARLEDYQEMAAAQERALSRLEALVSNMLLLVRSEQPLSTCCEVSLGPLLEEVVQELQPLAQEHGVSLVLENLPDLVVSGDELLLARVFSNLVENAICYNRPGGEVRVNGLEAEGQARISVADTGIGIAPEEQGRIFDRFYRVDSSRSRHSGGAGLGLSIVAAIVQQHHGQISLWSEPGCGSVFTVSLPLTPTGQAVARPALLSSSSCQADSKNPVLTHP
ncbi:sensor histidine kinase [Thermogemmatispora sp.]|uniref:sensor histidine kinase n=1 Tax=Thermogemmatispora sp. TaxID=1968838 RepID=UPI0035E3FB8D